MKIRKIEIKDNKEIKKLIKKSLEELRLDVPGTAYFDESLNDLYTYYSNLEHAEYWLAVVDGRIVGGIGIAPLDLKRNICELQKLYVAKEYQGQGISICLMDQALNFASKYYTACYLETTSDLEKARNLYKKYNFELLDSPLLETEHSHMDEWYIKYFK